MDYSQEKIYNLQLDSRVHAILELAETANSKAVRMSAWKLLESLLERLGMRWEYFVPR